MGSDQLITSFSTLCHYLLPFVGVLLLIAIICFVIHLIDVLKVLKVTLEKTNRIIDNADKKVEKLDKPLDTINSLSETVDHVHEASKTAVNSTAAMIIANMGTIKEWVGSKIEETKNEQKIENDEEVNE